MSASSWQVGTHISAQLGATCLQSALGGPRTRGGSRKRANSRAGNIDERRDIAPTDPQILFVVPKFGNVTVDTLVPAARTP